MGKPYEEKIKKHFQKAEREIDNIEPTAFRHSLDALAVHALNIINNFDKERFETDELYAEKWILYKNDLCRILNFNNIPR